MWTPRAAFPGCAICPSETAEPHFLSAQAERVRIKKEPAAGASMPFSQDQYQSSGVMSCYKGSEYSRLPWHAFQARVCQPPRQPRSTKGHATSRASELHKTVASGAALKGTYTQKTTPKDTIHKKQAPLT